MEPPIYLAGQQLRELTKSEAGVRWRGGPGGHWKKQNPWRKIERLWRMMAWKRMEKEFLTQLFEARVTIQSIQSQGSRSNGSNWAVQHHSFCVWNGGTVLTHSYMWLGLLDDRGHVAHSVERIPLHLQLHATSQAGRTQTARNLSSAPFSCTHLGLSENGVYPQYPPIIAI